MLAVVTALKVPKPGVQGNGTFEVLCRQPTWRGAARSARSLRAPSDDSLYFGCESEVSPLLPMAVLSVVTRYVAVKKRMHHWLTSYRRELPRARSPEV
jgi:hypothetical protein